MPDKDVIATLPCPNCQQQTPAGLRYCLRCGAESESPKAKRAITLELVCPQCNALDEYSVSFCINCGSKLDKDTDKGTDKAAVVQTNATAQAKPAGARRKTFCWKKPTAPLAKVENLRRLEKAEIAAPKVITVRSIAVAVLLGGLLGLAGWKTADGNSRFRRELEQYHWAGHALIVYAQPAQARITLAEEQNRQVAYARLRQDGLLDLPQLPAGKYRMYIESPGYKTAFGIITLEDGKPTVVGFPEPVKLSPL